jgi:putative heme-binding domain-containing protein
MTRRLVVLLLLLVPARLRAQHVYTDEEIAEGGRLYQANCERCHGAQGNTIQGIDLGRGQYRKPLDDNALTRVIRQGLPNTTMAPTNITDAQAGTVVAFIKSLAAANNRPRPANALPTGNVLRGQAVFEIKGACVSCHRVGTTGSRTGPDLTDVGSRMRQAEIELALLLPAAEVRPANRTIRVTPKSGAAVTGRLLNHDTLSLMMFDDKEQLRSFAKADLRDWSFVNSPMPSYRDRLTPQELADVVSYLLSLKGQ